MKTNEIHGNPNANGLYGTASHPLILGLMFTLVVCSAPLGAQSSVQEFIPFHRFLDHSREATAGSLTRPGSRAKAGKAFEEMRRHVLSMYQDVQVTHSFVLGSSHFDCVPMLQQPAVRVAGLVSIAPEPPQSLLADGNDAPAGRSRNLASLLERDKTSDEFGNSLRCEDGTIPMRRLTLEEMTQFPTLRDYFQKGPDGSGQPLQADSVAAPAADALSGHRYSRMYQSVDNLGGNSNLNIWRPYVNTALGEEFSLSQEWYLGGSGASLQTVEVGWQNYPKLYGDQNSRLFIYWTADNYQHTGCYNMDCGAFLQKNSSVALGSDFGNNYSTVGGTQYEFSAKYYLYQGNWWLAIQGTWIGYYPGAIFGGGQLTKHAQQIQFGTESLGTTVWPGEGSGDWSTKGWSQAAYQRNLFYYNTQGAPIWDTLTQWISSPGCYNVSGPFSLNSPGWTVYFLEGGPGGSGC